MHVELTKVREVPGVTTYWRVFRGRKWYRVQTYPGNSRFTVHTEKGHLRSLVSDIRRALLKVGALQDTQS